MIHYDDKQSLHLAPPSGIGNRIGGSNSSWTWLQYSLGVNLQDSNGRVITGGGSGGPVWNNGIVWTFVQFFAAGGGSATGSFNNNLITFNLTAGPAETVYATGLGTTTYTGPATTARVRFTGGPTPFPGETAFQILHSVTGQLALIIDPPDITTDPQTFSFAVPASVGATITISPSAFAATCIAGIFGTAAHSGTIEFLSP